MFIKTLLNFITNKKFNVETPIIVTKMEFVPATLYCQGHYKQKEYEVNNVEYKNGKIYLHIN